MFDTVDLCSISWNKKGGDSCGKSDGALRKRPIVGVLEDCVIGILDGCNEHVAPHVNPICSKYQRFNV